MRLPSAIVSAFLAVAAVAPSAHAVIACNGSVTNVSTNFDPAAGTTLVGSWTVNCTRAGGDPNTQNFSLGLNQGLYSPGGLNKRVKHTGSNNYYDYQAYTSGNNVWWNFIFGIGRIQGTVNFGGLLFGSDSGTFEVRAPAGQTAGPPGTYMDTLTWTLYNSATSFTAMDTGAFNVVFVTNAVCTMSSIPNLLFSYTSFQGAPALASANFTVTCSNWVPYTMALDNAGPITDNAVNLTYSLSLSAPGGTGTGLAQNYSVNGTMAAGQGGSCPGAMCNNTTATNKTRTLTVTY